MMGTTLRITLTLSATGVNTQSLFFNRKKPMSLNMRWSSTTLLSS